MCAEQSFYMSNPVQGILAQLLGDMVGDQTWAMPGLGKHPEKSRRLHISIHTR